MHEGTAESRQRGRFAPAWACLLIAWSTVGAACGGLVESGGDTGETDSGVDVGSGTGGSIGEPSATSGGAAGTGGSALVSDTDCPACTVDAHCSAPLVCVRLDPSDAQGYCVAATGTSSCCIVNSPVASQLCIDVSANRNNAGCDSLEPDCGP